MYSGYEITPQSREKLLSVFGTEFPNVICHHITEKFPVNNNTAAPEQPIEVLVIGYSICYKLKIECLIVSIDGKQKRPDGKIYHITLSLDKTAGAKPMDSNKITSEYTPVLQMGIDVIPKIFI